MIYLDNAATTKPNIDAIKFASKYNEELFYNASALYLEGLLVNDSLKEAKRVITNCFSNNYEIIFTSCGSESDNMVISSFSKRGNIVTTLGEHPAVYNTCKTYKDNGCDIRFAKLNKDGSVNIENLISLIDKNTCLVSVVHVNNETGAINDINNISKIVKSINKRLAFHSDGVQAFGKLPFIPNENIDFYSISAHKINGIKGVGGLFRHKNKNIKPFILGGGQENGLRSGTENIFGIKVFEFVTKKHFEKINDDYIRINEIKNEFIKNLTMDNFYNISGTNSSSYILCLSAKGLRGQVIQNMLNESKIIIGTGSACSSRHSHSRMLTEIGYEKDILDGVIRISFSCDTTINESIEAAKILDEKVIKLKRTILNG